MGSKNSGSLSFLIFLFLFFFIYEGLCVPSKVQTCQNYCINQGKQDDQDCVDECEHQRYVNQVIFFSVFFGIIGSVLLIALTYMFFSMTRYGRCLNKYDKDPKFMQFVNKHNKPCLTLMVEEEFLSKLQRFELSMAQSKDHQVFWNQNESGTFKSPI